MELVGLDRAWNCNLGSPGNPGNWAQLNQHRWTPDCGLDTASETDGGQFDERGYSTGVIYSDSDSDHDFGEEKIRQTGKGES